MRYGDPGMTSRLTADALFRRSRGGRPVALGADRRCPLTHAAAKLYVEVQQRPHLCADDRVSRSRALPARTARLRTPALAPVQAGVLAAAIDLLPPWARALHGFAISPAIAAPADPRRLRAGLPRRCAGPLPAERCGPTLRNPRALGRLQGIVSECQ